MTPAMIMPNCDDSVFAELLYGSGVVGMPRYEVNICLDTQVKQPFNRLLITLCVVCEVL